MRLEIKVTQPDIDKGVRGSSASCPLAHAIRREYPQHGDHIAVGVSRVNIGHALYQMDTYTELWVKDFDFERPVVPFTANIDLVNAFDLLKGRA